MYPPKLGTATVLAAALFLAASVLGQAAAPPVPAEDVTAVARGNTAFALDLYGRLRSREGNLFLSPYSISTALAMTRAGAGGETASQMDDVLHFTLMQDRLHSAFGALQNEVRGAAGESCEISVANALWGQRGYDFRKGFIKLVGENYGGGLRTVDFMRDGEGARKTINDWVESETREKIKDLIQPGVLTPLTRLVLTNAIYFKGDWASQFDKRNTREENFTLRGHGPVRSAVERIKTPMMHQTADFGYTETDAFQALEMPYAGDRLTMVVFLPKQEETLGGLERTLTAENLSAWLKMLRKQKVFVALPKFTMTVKFQLAETLKAMGMTDAFRLPPADFSGMIERAEKELFISHVIHKAFVDVHEEGTEAAAATGVVMELKSAPTRPLVFRADHPFVFIIRDTRTDSILFMGRVMDPRK